MLDFSSVGVRVLVGIVVIILGIVLLKFFNKDNENSITEYASPVDFGKQSALKGPNKLIQKLETLPPVKNASWAPSPVDNSMTPYGDWENNRFPSNFITNVASGFPENDEGASAARDTKWTPPSPANFALPDLTMRDELGPLPTPPLGYDDPFSSPLGDAF
jgi:hypothetical protein